jgi:orotate phosphoribosyltransferase
MDVVDALVRSGAVLRGHFQLSSGRHSDTYFEKFRLLEQPLVLTALVAELVGRFAGTGIEVVVGPTVGGALVAYEAARCLGVPARYLEREDGKRTLRRGAALETGTRVLLVDDVLTTGLSLRECLPALSHVELVGIGVLLARTSEPQSWPSRFETLASLDVPSWDSAECPLCAQGAPLMEPGSRHLGK